MNTPSHRQSSALPQPQPQSRPHLNAASRNPGAPTVESPSGAELLEPADVLRITLERRRCHYSDPHLERFALDFFANDYMVWAYFYPRAAGPITQPKSNASKGPLNEPVVWTPLQVAMVAANQAQSMAIVLPHEREFVHLAALVYPCDFFHSVRNAATQGYEHMADAPDWRAHLRGIFMRDPLRVLSRQAPAVADSLRSVLGLPWEGNAHPEQVSRLSSAVHLAHLQTQAVWAASRV